MKPRRILLTNLILLATTLIVRTDEPGKTKPTKATELDGATHVVNGQVTGVYKATKMKSPEHVDTEFILELLISYPRKGEGLVKDTVLYARGWQSQKRPEGYVGSRGQAEIPNVGDYADFYLTKDKMGRYDLLVPNGVQRPKGPDAPADR